MVDRRDHSRLDKYAETLGYKRDGSNSYGEPLYKGPDDSTYRPCRVPSPGGPDFVRIPKRVVSELPNL